MKYMFVVIVSRESDGIHRVIGCESIDKAKEVLTKEFNEIKNGIEAADGELLNDGLSFYVAEPESCGEMYFGGVYPIEE